MRGSLQRNKAPNRTQGPSLLKYFSGSVGRSLGWSDLRDRGMNAIVPEPLNRSRATPAPTTITEVHPGVPECRSFTCISPTSVNSLMTRPMIRSLCHSNRPALHANRNITESDKVHFEVVVAVVLDAGRHVATGTLWHPARPSRTHQKNR